MDRDELEMIKAGDTHKARLLHEVRRLRVEVYEHKLTLKRIRNSICRRISSNIIIKRDDYNYEAILVLNEAKNIVLSVLEKEIKKC